MDAELKKLHEIAYNLGIEEAKEMTRGKYLKILNSDGSSWSLYQKTVFFL